MCPIYRADTVLEVRIIALVVQDGLVWTCIPSGELDICAIELFRYKRIKDAMNTSKCMMS